MLNFVKVVILCLFVLFATNVMANTCCQRELATIPIPMPPGETYDYSGMLSTAFESIFFNNRKTLWDCPLEIGFLSYEGSQMIENLIGAIGNAYGHPADPEITRMRARHHNMLGCEYIFKGILTVGPDPEIWEGSLYGNFTLNMQLLDNCRGTVVKEAQTSWDGSHTGTAGDGGIIGRVGKAAVDGLAMQFMPLDYIIDDYESTPDLCTISPEKEEVKIGEEINIDLIDIKAKVGEVEQEKVQIASSWQRILVKVEQGKVLNATEQWEGEGYYVFEVGNGKVTVEYKAPDKCPENKTETVTVYNTCNICPELGIMHQDKIAEKEIEIVCESTIEYEEHWETLQTLPDGEYYFQDTERGEFPFTIVGNTVEGGELTELFYTGDGHRIQGNLYCEIIATQTALPLEMHVANGHITPNESGPPSLFITLGKMMQTGHETNYHEYCTCPEPHCPYELDDPVVAVVDNYIPYNFELLLEDGYTYEQTETISEGMTGTWKLILHLNE